MRAALSTILFQSLGPRSGGGASTDTIDLAQALAGDQACFERLVRRYHATLTRFLRLYVPEPGLAEDAAQDTWMAVLKGRNSFEGRASFRTWLFKVGAGRARDLSRKLGRDEARSRSWSEEAQSTEHTIPRRRFLASDHPKYPEHWAEPPSPCPRPRPDDLVMRQEAARHVHRELEQLPPAMAAVVTLRDFAGMTGNDAATSLGISEANQRVLLHRARLRLWAAWETYEADT